MIGYDLYVFRCNIVCYFEYFVIGVIYDDFVIIFLIDRGGVGGW